MKTKHKIFIAKIIFFIVKYLGFKVKNIYKRNNIYWNLNLSEAIDLSIFLFGNFEKNVLNSLKKINLEKPFDIIDIGANIGSQTLRFANSFPESKVYAIEPTDYAFEKLKQNVLLNKRLSENIFIYQFFITNNKHKIENVYSKWNLTDNNFSHNEHKGQFSKTLNAKTISLDDFFYKNNIKEKIFIKLDVDGHEFHVLKSGQNFLKKNKPPILMELAPYLYKEYGYNQEKILKLIISLNYNFYDLKKLKKIFDIEQKISSIKDGSSENILLM